eukprot:8796516-Pyramimonas_sp.AAC.1
MLRDPPTPSTATLSRRPLNMTVQGAAVACAMSAPQSRPSARRRWQALQASAGFGRRRRSATAG